MIPTKRNMTHEEIRAFRREEYEMEKEGLIEFYKEQYPNGNTLNVFLVNSLKIHYETELKEDGLI